jgi:hypothetical protein
MVTVYDLRIRHCRANIINSSRDPKVVCNSYHESSISINHISPKAKKKKEKKKKRTEDINQIDETANCD